MTGMREKDQADFDLEAFIDLFDEALTSDDPSVQKTLQHLMVICALARNHDKHNSRTGPLRRMFEDQSNILRRLERLEVGHPSLGGAGGGKGWPGGGYNPSAPYGPVNVPLTQPYTTPAPGTGTGTWPPTTGTYPPGTIWGGSSTSYTWDPVGIAKKINGGNLAGSAIAERVENLLKDEKYQGSSVGANDVKTA